MEWVKIISIIIAGVFLGLLWVVKYFKDIKKNKTTSEQIEQLGGEVIRLKFEKKTEQWKITKERGDILYSEFLKVFCDEMNVNEDSRQAGAYDALILNNVRKQTDKLMHEAIDRNNMAERNGDEWIDYKNRKFKFILSQIIQYIKTIWRDDIIGFKHEEVVNKCREEIVKIYFDHINAMFEEIKKISLKYEEKINIHKKILEELKNNKGL